MGGSSKLAKGLSKAVDLYIYVEGWTDGRVVFFPASRFQYLRLVLVGTWQIIQGNPEQRKCIFFQGQSGPEKHVFKGVSIPGTDIVGQDVNDGNCANDKITDERR